MIKSIKFLQSEKDWEKLDSDMEKTDHRQYANGIRSFC